MIIRQAEMADAAEISTFLQQLTALGKRNLPSDRSYVETHYIAHPDSIQCAVAVDDDLSILGLQILKWAREGNEYDVTPGWGIIGTHVRPDAGRRGVGKNLFAATGDAAKAAGLSTIDATIGAQNAEGLGYYSAMGFETYIETDTKVRKRFDVEA